MIKEETMARTGKPPHVGWWCVSLKMNYWCWWDGECWSIEASPSDPMCEVIEAANTRRVNQDVKWCTFYPENARIVRVKGAI